MNDPTKEAREKALAKRAAGKPLDDNELLCIGELSGDPLDGTVPVGGADIQIATLDVRENGDRVVVRWRRFQGQHFVDVRVWFVSAGGELRPSSKGIAIRIGEIWNLSDAFTKAIALARTVRA